MTIHHQKEGRIMQKDRIDKDAIRANVPGIAEFAALHTQHEVIALAYLRCMPTADDLVPVTVREILRNYGRYSFNAPNTLQILREAKDEYVVLLPDDAPTVLRDNTPLAAPADGAPRRWALRLFGVANARLAVAYAVAMCNTWADLHDRPHPDRLDVVRASLGTWAAGLIRIPEPPRTQQAPRDSRSDDRRDDRRRSDTPLRQTPNPRKSGRRD